MTAANPAARSTPTPAGAASAANGLKKARQSATAALKKAVDRVAFTATPAGMIPKVRRPEFDLAADTPMWWWDNDPFKTLLLAALSSGFPPGERFFIDSVRHYQSQITDPELHCAMRSLSSRRSARTRTATASRTCWRRWTRWTWPRTR